MASIGRFISKTWTWPITVEDTAITHTQLYIVIHTHGHGIGLGVFKDNFIMNYIQELIIIIIFFFVIIVLEHSAKATVIATVAHVQRPFIRWCIKIHVLQNV